MEASTSRVGMIRCDADWVIRGANRSAGELLHHTELVGENLARLSFGERLLERSSRDCPYSRFIDCGPGLSQFLVNVSRLRADRLIAFEPADWSLASWRQFDDADILVTDETGRVVFLHEGYRRPPVIPPHMLLGRTLVELGAELAPELGPTERRVEAVLAGNTDWDHIEIPFPDGTSHTFNVRLQPWRYCGCTCGILLVGTDVTCVRDAAAQDASAAMYRAWTALQHGLRNPLQTMQAVVDTLGQRAGEVDPSLLRTLGQQIQLIHECLADQLLVEAPDPRTMLPVKLSALVRREIEQASMRLITGELRFRHSVLDCEPLVAVNSAHLGRVFANLFRDIAQRGPAARVSIDYAIRDTFLACTVTHDGPAFPRDVLRTGWAQPKEPGAFPGLALAAATLEAHGGAMVFGNREDGRSFVELRVPMLHRPSKSAL